MEIITLLWNNYLYIPGFNFLVWVYLNYSGFNLGISIILITILLRIVLLPFTILNEKGKAASQELAKEVATIKQDMANDPVGQKEEIRKAFKKKKIRPWAKAVILGIQGMTLVLLYQIFISGIDARSNLQLLYPSIPRPDFINTNFLGFDLAERSMILAGVVAGYLLIEIIFNYWINKKGKTRKEQIFAILFPTFVFLVLIILPSVKSIFVLTSLVFSSIISMFIHFIKLSYNKAKQG